MHSLFIHIHLLPVSYSQLKQDITGFSLQRICKDLLLSVWHKISIMICAQSNKCYLYTKLIYKAIDAGPFLCSCPRPPSEATAEGWGTTTTQPSKLHLYPCFLCKLNLNFFSKVINLYRVWFWVRIVKGGQAGFWGWGRFGGFFWIVSIKNVWNFNIPQKLDLNTVTNKRIILEIQQTT